MTSEIFPEQAAQLPSSNNIARRSVSIFSRKGTDSPIQSTQALVIPGNSMIFGSSSPTTGSSSVGKARSKRWTLTGRLESKIPEGTILRAVPKDAPKTSMTPLEREMATSPNEEILRAIGLCPESAPTSPVDRSPSSPLRDSTNMTPRRYYSKRGKKVQEDYLGVWHNGEVSWGQENATTKELHPRPKTSDGNRPSSSGSQKNKLVKPKIQVIIPENHSAKRPFSFMPFFHNVPGDRSISADISPPPPSIASKPSTDPTHVSVVSPPIAHRTKLQKQFQPITVAIDESSAFDGSLLGDRPPHSRTTSVNSSNSDSEADDVTISHSSRSSMTSIGVHNDEQPQLREGKLSRKGSSSSEASFVTNDDAAVMSSRIRANSNEDLNQENPSVQGPRMNDMVSLMRTSSATSRTASGRRKRLSSSRGQVLLAKINSKEELRLHGDETTPTLDEAVEDLENSLSSFAYDHDGADAPEVVETAIVETSMSPIPEIVLSPAGAPPALPRKSSRRQRLSFPPQPELVEAPTSPPTPRAPLPERTSSLPNVSQESFNATMAAARLEQRRHELQSRKRERHESAAQLRRMSSVRSVLSLVREEEESPSVETDAAELVVYHILSELRSMDDLFNAALITKGFYQIFKLNELELMRNALRKQCAPTWEYLESCLGAEEAEDDSAAPTPDYTPPAYFQAYKSAVAVTSSLKQLIMTQCPSLLTAETLASLKGGASDRVDAALFRIWTFCQVFGSNKGREDDIVAQMDWLRGGLLAHQDTCSSTISNHDSFYISSVLLSAPEHFAQGNVNGLSAEELYDMLEMWNCLVKLTSGVVGKTEQARQFGIFDETDIAGGDVDGEEAMLEEWQAYLLTLGLAPVLDIVVALTTEGSHSAFAVAQYNGLTQWDAPLVGSSRSAFLHEAVTRLYEERICEAFSPEQVQMKEMRSLRRSRDSEFRQRRLSTRSSPYADRTPRLSREWGSFRSAEGPVPSTRSSFGSGVGPTRSSSVNVRRAPPPIQTNLFQNSSSIRRSYYPANATIAEEQLPAYNSAAEAARERENMHPLQRALVVENHPGVNSVDMAVHRIHEMGFTVEEAKGALKITDMGDGLRVDRAVEYLMRSKGYA